MFNFLDNADELMKADRKGEAKEVIEKWLKNEKASKGVYQDAVAIYLFGHMYTEAKRVFDLYRQRHGKELVTDYGAYEVIKIFQCGSFW